jgi:hypothetical protein
MGCFARATGRGRHPQSFGEGEITKTHAIFPMLRKIRERPEEAPLREEALRQKDVRSAALSVK